MTLIENTRTMDPRRLVPFATPFLYATLCYLAAAIPFLLEGTVAVAATIAAFVACCAGTAYLALFSVERDASILARISVATTPTLLTAGSFLFLLLIDSPALRFVTVAGCVVLVTAFHGRADAVDDRSFANLSRAVRTVALFFLLAFSFGITRFIHVPLPLMVAFAGIGLALSANQDLRGVVTDNRLAAAYGAVTGLLGAELYLGLSFLPTLFMTNAAVLLVAMELISTAMRNVFVPLGQGRLLPRGHILASGLLTAALLGTSPWF